MASEVRASHILVKTQDEANNILNQIRGGKKFDKMAKKYSDCPSGKRGGDLGYFTRGRMVREFEEAAFSMNVGQISAPIKTQFGYHIIMVTDKR